MRILFVGGTGLISTACSAAAVAAGHELWLLNRGRSSFPSCADPSHVLTADATDETEVRAAVKDSSWDVVVQWVGYAPSLAEQDIRVFQDVGQYVFISSASVYEKPPAHWIITENTPRNNPYWSYAREKIACEQVLQEAHKERGFPMTIVRPSLTYGPSQIPVVIGSWDKPYTIIDRMRRGAKIIVPGDGTSIWTLTHNTDFAKGLIGLLGQPAALGEDFNITSDEALSWNQIYSLVGAAAGAPPDILHVPAAGIIASDPGEEGNLWGDKAYSTVFDNSKLRRIVPGYVATKKFAEGIRETVAWFDADASRQEIDHAANARWDRLAAVYTEALAKAAGDADQR
jgi:nucleoside-diphosphate-sugar epimerase